MVTTPSTSGSDRRARGPDPTSDRGTLGLSILSEDPPVVEHSGEGPFHVGDVVARQVRVVFIVKWKLTRFFATPGTIQFVRIQWFRHAGFMVARRRAPSTRRRETSVSRTPTACSRPESDFSTMRVSLSNVISAVVMTFRRTSTGAESNTSDSNVLSFPPKLYFSCGPSIVSSMSSDAASIFSAR